MEECLLDSRLRYYKIQVMIKEKNFNLMKGLSPDIPQISYLYQNLFSRGKTLRASMTSQVASCLQIPEEKSNHLGKIVEHIHQASILHDDVIDASPIRRGSLSSWMQYSMKKAVLAGDYLLAQASWDTAEMKNLALMKITAEMLKSLVKGEWMQDMLKNKETMPELKKVHELKTSSLFQWSLRAPFLIIDRYENKLHERLSKIGSLMGLLFQRADDLLDFDIRNKENKASFKDMAEGYFNYFAVYLSEGRGQDFRSILKSCRSLAEVKNLLGEESFKQVLRSFDEMNENLIKDCQKEISLLKENLYEKEKLLIDELRKWPARFYWR